MKKLNGSELAGFIKERQRKQAATVAQQLGRKPMLAILKTVNDPAINTYVKLKQRYGSDIGVNVVIHEIDQPDVKATLGQLNEDEKVDAIIVQLPLADTKKTDETLQLVSPQKDVDGLHDNSDFDSATATAILWLLAGYNINLAGKAVAVIGQGRLVGKPIADYLELSGNNVERCDKSTKNLEKVVQNSEVLITATGEPGLIKSAWLPSGTIVVDAGVAGEKGELRGDVEEQALDREDILTTPKRGGLGPLTVCALFENVLKAARTTAE